MTWELDDKKATFETDSLTASFDGNSPFRGLRIQSNGDANSVAQLFSFLLSEAPAETYVRGDDLVSKYPPRNSDLVSYTTYHQRVTSNEPSAEYDGVQLILSAQTHLLDSAPLTQIVSEFANAQLFYKPGSGGDLRVVEGEHVFAELAPQFFLVRYENDASHSWVLLIHPTDFHRGAVRLEPAPTVTLHVFPDALEKGVIRRATLKCCRVNRDNDEQIASQLFETLESAAPPLTT